MSAALPSIETFRCVPLSCLLTPSSCGRRHLEAVPLTSASGGPRPIAPVCRECPTGAAHSKGERPELWPDGSPIVRLGTTPRPTPAPAAPDPSARKQSMPRPASQLTWNGRTQSPQEWADELGVSKTTVYARVKKGLGPDGSEAVEEVPEKPKRAKAKSEPRAKRELAELTLTPPPVAIDAVDLLSRLDIAHEVIATVPRGRLVLLIEGQAS